MATRQNVFLMVSGPSGVGKTSFVNKLIERWPEFYMRPISYTSRSRRQGEGDSEYHFVDKEWILEESKQGRLANLDFVYGNYYGMRRASIEEAFVSERTLIKEIHPANHFKIRNLFKNCAAIVFLPDIDSAQWPNEASDARTLEDAAFYSEVNLNDFEIIVWSAKASSLDTLVADTHFAIQVLLKNSTSFPSPCEIDKINAEGYGKIAGRFIASERPTTSNFHDLSAPYFANVINGIPSGAACIEIGPGQGWLRKAFQWPAIQYTALDIAPNMISTLDFEAHDSSKIAASARAMPFPSGSFDYVFSSLGDGYCYPLALAEIRRILKTNGRLFFSAPSAVWSSGFRQQDRSNKTEFKLPSGENANVFSFVYTLDMLITLFSECGFHVIQAEEVRGDSLPQNREISSALVDSAETLGVPLESLPIVNVLTAAKSK